MKRCTLQQPSARILLQPTRETNSDQTHVGNQPNVVLANEMHLCQTPTARVVKNSFLFPRRYLASLCAAPPVSLFLRAVKPASALEHHLLQRILRPFHVMR